MTGRLFKRRSGKVDRVIAFEPHPEAGYYYRSDHFNFAKAGILLIYRSGIDVMGKEKEYGKTRKKCIPIKTITALLMNMTPLGQ